MKETLLGLSKKTCLLCNNKAENAVQKGNKVEYLCFICTVRVRRYPGLVFKGAESEKTKSVD